MKILSFEEFINEGAKFTFKTTKPTGRYRSFSSSYHDIKYKGETVGAIDPEDFKIRLMIMKDEKNTDNNPNCPWKWITLKGEHESLEKAKEWVNANVDKIMSQWTLKKPDNVNENLTSAQIKDLKLSDEEIEQYKHYTYEAVKNIKILQAAKDSEIDKLLDCAKHLVTGDLDRKKLATLLHGIGIKDKSNSNPRFPYGNEYWWVEVIFNEANKRKSGSAPDSWYEAIS